MSGHGASTDAEGSVLVPPGTRILHIGPHKTGTTSLQGAFHLARRAAERQGVHYAGRNAQPMNAAYAVTARTPTYASPVPMSRWRELVRDVEDAGEQRVVISSEGFCDADDAAIARIVRDLGRDRLHIVVTLRPIGSILPSQYQQFVQGGLVTAWEPWLQAMLADPPRNEASPLFWFRHRHDELVARWVRGVGPERVTVIVADDRDHAVVPRVFERLTGLRPGTLTPEWNYANRSLTRAEIGLVRALNTSLRRVGMARMAHNKLMRVGVTELIKRRPPDRDEPRLALPAWALPRVGALAREIVDGIAASGVRVIGDLEALAPPVRSAAATDKRAVTATADAGAWPDVVTAASMGVLLTASSLRTGSGAGRAWPDGDETPASAWQPVTDPRGGLAAVVSTNALQRQLVGRTRALLRPGDRARIAVARLRGLGGRSASIHSAGVEIE